MTEKNTNKEFIDIKSFYDKYIKYWPALVIFVAVFFILGIVYYLLAPRFLQINANILIKEEEQGPGQTMAAMQSLVLGSVFGNVGTSVNDEILLLNSYSLLRNVGRDLGLNVIYKKKKFPFDVDYYHNSPIKVYTVNGLDESLRRYLKFQVEVDSRNVCKIKAKSEWKTIGQIKSDQFPIKMETAYGTFYFDTTGYFKKNKPLEMEIDYMGYDLTTEILKDRILIDQVSKKANVVSLQIIDNNMKRGKDILNVLVDRYNENGNKDKNLEAAQMKGFLDERIHLIESELNDVENSIEQYKKENNITDIETEAKIILDKSQDFKEKLIDAEAQYTVIELVEQFLMKPENEYSLVPMNIGLNDRTVLQGLSDYNDALLKRIGLLQTTKSENPSLSILNVQIDKMRSNMLETVRSIKSGLSRIREDLLKQEQIYLNRIGNMPKQEREYLTIKRQQMIKQELFLLLLQKREENSLTEALVKPKATVVDSAYALIKPVSPRLMLTLMFSILLGLVCSVGYIMVAECMKRRKNNK